MNYDNRRKLKLGDTVIVEHYDPKKIVIEWVLKRSIMDDDRISGDGVGEDVKCVFPIVEVSSGPGLL